VKRLEFNPSREVDFSPPYIRVIVQIYPLLPPGSPDLGVVGFHRYPRGDEVCRHFLWIVQERYLAADHYREFLAADLKYIFGGEAPEFEDQEEDNPYECVVKAVANVNSNIPAFEIGHPYSLEALAEIMALHDFVIA
jgi:hypothetical protein